MLKDAIAKNRFRQSRFKKYEKVLRRLRQRIFDYEDIGKGDKASMLIKRCKIILEPYWKAHAEAREKAQSDRMMHTYT